MENFNFSDSNGYTILKRSLMEEADIKTENEEENQFENAVDVEKVVEIEEPIVNKIDENEEEDNKGEINGMDIEKAFEENISDEKGSIEQLSSNKDDLQEEGNLESGETIEVMENHEGERLENTEEVIVGHQDVNKKEEEKIETVEELHSNMETKIDIEERTNDYEEKQETIEEIKEPVGVTIEVDEKENIADRRDYEEKQEAIDEIIEDEEKRYNEELEERKSKSQSNIYITTINCQNYYLDNVNISDKSKPKGKNAEVQLNALKSPQKVRTVSSESKKQMIKNVKSIKELCEYYENEIKQLFMFYGYNQRGNTKQNTTDKTINLSEVIRLLKDFHLYQPYTNLTKQIVERLYFSCMTDATVKELNLTEFSYCFVKLCVISSQILDFCSM